MKTTPNPVLHRTRLWRAWLYVIDARTPTPAAEVPAYDIIGAFEVREGAVVPQAYQPNGNHWLFSSNGLFKLDPTLHEKLMDRVVKQAQTSQDLTG